MFGSALYYPYMDIPDSRWLRSAILFWDDIQTIAPSSVAAPYKRKDTRVCAEEGYLRPLRCDLYPGLLDDLGRRVLKLLADPDWRRPLGKPSKQSVFDPRHTLAYAENAASRFKSGVHRSFGIHPDKMPPELRYMLSQPVGAEVLSVEKMTPSLEKALRGFRGDRPSVDRTRNAARDAAHVKNAADTANWIVVEGRFADLYMTALASLLSKEAEVSALTNEEAQSGVNLRFLLDDVADAHPNAAHGALVSVVMKGLNIDPEVSIKKVLKFRRRRADQLAELAGVFDDLKRSIATSGSRRELKDSARRAYENKIQPGLSKLKRELRTQTIQSAWEGIQRMITISAPAGLAASLAAGLSAPVLLGAGALVTLADVTIKGHLARNKARNASSYAYLFDVERKFSLPRR